MAFQEKRGFALFLGAILFLTHCAHHPPPKEKVKTEFLLLGTTSPSGQAGNLQEALGKKRQFTMRLNNSAVRTTP